MDFAEPEEYDDIRQSVRQNVFQIRRHVLARAR